MLIETWCLKGKIHLFFIYMIWVKYKCRENSDNKNFLAKNRVETSIQKFLKAILCKKSFRYVFLI